MSVAECKSLSVDASPEETVHLAASLLVEEDEGLRSQLERLPAPIYLTDADGFVTWFNSACVDFAGRQPISGRDRWCITWRLHTEGGAPLAHEEWPLAIAVRERRPVRGVVAVAERPDGTRVIFAPYPTPVTDREGQLIGAVNLLVDVTDRRQAESLRAQATRCRRLARSITDTRAITTLTLMAEEYEAQARALVE